MQAHEPIVGRGAAESRWKRLHPRGRRTPRRECEKKAYRVRGEERGAGQQPVPRWEPVPQWSDPFRGMRAKQKKEVGKAERRERAVTNTGRAKPGWKPTPKTNKVRSVRAQKIIRSGEAGEKTWSEDVGERRLAKDISRGTSGRKEEPRSGRSAGRHKGAAQKPKGGGRQRAGTLQVKIG